MREDKVQGSNIALDETEIRSMPFKKRLEKLDYILKNSNDNSKRWDAVWLAGELAEEVTPNSVFFQKIADLLAWSLKNDKNIIVRHEISYQIAGRGMRDKIPDLIQSALYDPSDLVRHESVECLGIIQANEHKTVIEQALKDPSENVRITAQFVLDRMVRVTCKQDTQTNAF